MSQPSTRRSSTNIRPWLNLGFMLLLSLTTYNVLRNTSRPALLPISRALGLSTMSSSTSPNASGLTPNESKALTERQPSQDEQKILSAIRELYSCKPQEVHECRSVLCGLLIHVFIQSSYSIYAPNAVFHDPIGIARGVDTIKSQFNGLPKVKSCDVFCVSINTHHVISAFHEIRNHELPCPHKPAKLAEVHHPSRPGCRLLCQI